MSEERDAAVSFHYELVRCVREGTGLPEDVAVPLARHLLRALQRRLGGLYVPKSDIRRARDAEVREAFNGRNHGEVMNSFRISRATLYRILGNSQTREK